MASSSSTRCAQVWRARIVSQAALDERLAQVRDRRGWREDAAPSRLRRGPSENPGRAGTAPPRRPTARRPAGCRRPAPRTPGSSECPAASRHRSGAARARSRDGARRPRAPRRWAASRDSARRSAEQRRARLRRDSARRRCRAAGRRSRAGANRKFSSSALRSSSPQLPIQTRPSPLALDCAGGWNSRVSAASCQTNTRSPQPQRSIDVGQRLAEGEHAVVAVEIVAPDRVGVADRAMMRVVEQQRETAAAPTRRADARRRARARSIRARSPRRRRRALRRDRLWADRCVEREFGIGLRGRRRGRPRRGRSSRLCRLQAPARLVGRDLVAAMHQLAQHAAQEMRVAVVPARGQRMGEIRRPSCRGLPGSDWRSGDRRQERAR